MSSFGLRDGEVWCRVARLSPRPARFDRFDDGEWQVIMSVPALGYLDAVYDRRPDSDYRKKPLDVELIIPLPPKPLRWWERWRFVPTSYERLSGLAWLTIVSRNAAGDGALVIELMGDGVLAKQAEVIY